jgi:hypothetical protein
MLNKIKISVVFTLLIVSVFSCKSKKMQTEEPILVTNGKKVTRELLSFDKSKILVLNFIDDLNLQKNFLYTVLDAKTKKEVLKGTFFGTKMEWNNNSSIKGYLYQGIVQEENDTDDSNKFKIIKINLK